MLILLGRNVHKCLQALMDYPCLNPNKSILLSTLECHNGGLDASGSTWLCEAGNCLLPSNMATSVDISGHICQKGAVLSYSTSATQ